MKSLQEFTTGNFAWTQKDLIFAEVYFGEGTVVRPVRLSKGSTTSSLESILTRTDEELSNLAKRCGSFVLPHVWGIIKLTDQEHGLFEEKPHYITYRHPEIGEDCVLAAEVEIIKQDFSSASFPDKKKIHEGIRSYRGVFNRVVNFGQGLLLDAARPDQFSYGTTNSIAKPSAILHDIEPILY